MFCPILDPRNLPPGVHLSSHTEPVSRSLLHGKGIPVNHTRGVSGFHLGDDQSTIAGVSIASLWRFGTVLRNQEKLLER